MATGASGKEIQTSRGLQKMENAMATQQASDNYDSTKRKDRIQSLISNINGMMASKQKRPKSHGRHKVHKLYTGWRHSEGVDKPFKMVRFKDGGGVRCIEYPVDQPQSVSSITQLGLKLFFPEGKNQFGSLENLELSLGNFSGRFIDEFKDTEGQPCTFQEYLHSYGLFSSKTHVYILTQVKVDKHTTQKETTSSQCAFEFHTDNETAISAQTMLEELCSSSPRKESYNKRLRVLNPKSPGNLQIKYLAQTESSFSEVITRISCHSWSQCREMCFSSEVHDGDYNPLLNGYKVLSIEKGGKQLLDYDYKEDGSIKFKFPSSSDQEQIILHGPGEVSGTEEQSDIVILGVVASCHGQGCQYTWFKNGLEYVTSPDLPLLEVKEPGTYGVCVTFGDSVNVCQETVTVDDASYPSSEESANINDIKEDSGSTSPPSTGKTFRGLGRSVSSTMNVAHLNSAAINPPHEAHRVNVAIPFIDKKDVSFADAVEIGKGSFGNVFKAVWIGTPVAVKEIRVKRMKVLRNVVHGEIQLQGRVRHPNIALLMAYAIEKSHVYILSEYVNGPNLDEILFGCAEDTKGADFVLTFPQKIVITEDILKAVAYLHHLRPPVIHTDIKPENIIVHRQSLTAKLCDFGVSRVKGIESQVCTGGNLSPGTPMYQAPEVLLKTEKSCKASDVWSMACTLTELFAEESIWSVDITLESTDIAQIKHKMHNKEVPSAYQVLINKPGYDASVCDLLGSGLKYPPDDRSSAFNMLTNVQNFPGQSHVN